MRNRGGSLGTSERQPMLTTGTGQPFSPPMSPGVTSGRKDSSKSPDSKQILGHRMSNPAGRISTTREKVCRFARSTRERV